MAKDKVQAAPVAPASRGLTDGFYANQGVDTDGFTSPGESIQNTLSGTGKTGATESGTKAGRVTASDRAARRNKIGEDDKTMFNQLSRFDDKDSGTAPAASSAAAQASIEGNFAGQKYKP